MKTINLFILFGIISLILFSCDVGLGSRLDLEGPMVEFTYPIARKAVGSEFVVEGSASDFTGIQQLLLRAEIGTDNGNIPFEKQWRFDGGVWEVSEDYGESWSSLSGAEWNGGIKSGEWKIPVDLKINSINPDDGEYIFILQAWDLVGNSDENSFNTRVFIIDTQPPKVDVSNPYLYRWSGNQWGNATPDLLELHVIGDNGPERKNPSMIGKFLTQEFLMQWQIDDNHDVWSIDIRLYEHSVLIDDNHETPLPDNYIYKYHHNVGPPPSIPDPQNNARPNGSVIVPALTREAGNYDGNGELKNPITQKTTIKVVATCYDSAGNPNQEKTIGYFVYWPAADMPWITFTGKMEGIIPGSFYNVSFNQDDIFMIYPGRSVRATAFQAHGVSKVQYSLYRLTENPSNNQLTGDRTPVPDMIDVDIINTPRPGTTALSTVFPWEFSPPPRSGYYLLSVRAYGIDENSIYYEGEEHTTIFRVQDITFPDFPIPPSPAASRPLYEFIGKTPQGTTPAVSANTIRIHGIVSDATMVKNLTMVWINPESRNFAAMSQLAYFRDKDYQGWKDALALTLPDGASSISGEEVNSLTDPNYPYDRTHRNRLWKIRTTQIGYDSDNRMQFSYQVDINLNALNIGPDANQQPLRSQIFLLRVENPDGKCTIITYAPQGDTSPPVINITNVEIKGQTYIPNQFAIIPKFSDGDNITINGTWREDSSKDLAIATYFTPNFEVKVNSLPISSSLTQTGEAQGTWVSNIILGSGSITADDLRDTLVISVDAKDIGGNKAETGASWLIESDNLRLMRISSEELDQTYNQGKIIRIFLEFNKPVQLKAGVANPVLTLNSATGATATYVPSTTQSTRQYFQYTVAAGHSTGAGHLNVAGIQTGTPVWTAATYPLAWTRGTVGSDSYEEIRITNVAGHNGDRPAGQSFYARNLPVTTDTGNLDYQFTLAAGKHIGIDTAAPTIATTNGIISNTAQGNYRAGEIYITLNFNKPVMIGSTLPRLTLQIGNNANAQTSNDPDDVRVNDRAITFVYRIQPGDTSNGNAIVVNNYTPAGSITDLAGTAFATNGISSLPGGTRTLTGVFVDTTAPGVPTVRVLSAATIGVNNANVVSQSVSGTTHQGLSTVANRNLSNVYNTNLWLAVEGNTTAGAHKLQFMEYSTNNGTSWVRVPNSSNTPFAITQTGSYQIIARQTDRAGNVSATNSPQISFTWDPGNLITRISSATPNGTYTHVTGRNTIAITLHFRKNVVVVANNPTITLNAQRANNTFITVPAAVVGGAVNSLTFNYTVTNGDYINGDAMLNVTGITGLSVWDGTGLNNGVNLTTFTLPTGENALNGNGNKDFRVKTGNLTAGTPSFVNDTAWMGAPANETNPRFQGIRSDDGSYWTTLEIDFTSAGAITKGSGNITITPNETGYVLPTVLTEAQYNRFRGVAGFDTYYVRGTNGFIFRTTNADSGSDTSTKYILQYNYNPRRSVTSPNVDFTGDTAVPAGFHDAFRAAETITIPVNAQAVVIEGNKLKVRLTGSNAPQVPGATYTVAYPAGFVQDDLGNQITAGSHTSVTLAGVARPFVRIRKPQEVISTQTGNANTPRLTAAQPFQAFARMDTRTPSAQITYTNTVYSADAQTAGYTNTAAVNFTTGGGPTGRPTIVRPTSANATQYNTTTGLQITLGSEAGSTNQHQGYQWWVRARATVNTTNSFEAEEKAYRTVITYQLNNGGNAITAGAGEQIMGTGDQIWIRGGDSIGSSSIPGFPVTWEDNWNNMSGRRAGIRLMTKTNNTSSLNNSEWKFVTWDINTTAYVDFIMGRDAASTANVAWQYGPSQWAYQRAGWTSFKTSFPIYPGEHRWCNAGVDHAGKGAINFSATFSARPTDLVFNVPGGNSATY